MELKVNDYIKIKPDIAVGGTLKLAQQQDWLLKVTQIDGAYIYAIKIYDANGRNTPTITSRKESLDKVVIENFEKYIKKVIYNNRKKSRELLKKIIKKHESILKSKIESKSQRPKLGTVSNIAALISSRPNKNNLKQYYSSSVGHFEAGCCSFTRGDNSILVYIPKTWLNYYGYNLADLKNWLKFLRESDINYNGEYVKTLKLIEVFPNYKNRSNFYLSNNHSYHLDLEEDCYEILIPSSDRNQNYINFILTRFLYSPYYWNIPKITLKLRKNLKIATNWECLLLAHNAESYSGGYSLFEASYSGRAYFPTKANSYANSIVQKYKSGLTTLNSSFTVTHTNVDVITKFKKDLFEENYKELENLIKNCRNVN